MPSFHLANYNYARMRVDSRDDPVMDGFMSRLDEINAIAEASPGFVWRLQDGAGDATGIRVADPRDLINLTVWESLEALSDFVHRSRHAELIRQRREWFLPPEGSSLVLWWVRAGVTPALDDAIERLERLNREGPSPDGFTFQKHWPPPVEPAPQRASRIG
ncbi:MAG: DUF3291 domain-containing protein [Acidobacteriota bacterium]|nr:DUF3291 domain-containing protein [Acidobacteriota bacterium]